MACNKDLQADNQPYPRTCADCGLGPCKKYPKTAPRPTTAKDLAAAIMGMNYGDLKSVARDLAAACEDKEARPKMETTEDFADLLYYWAEAQS